MRQRFLPISIFLLIDNFHLLKTAFFYCKCNISTENLQAILPPSIYVLTDGSSNSTTLLETSEEL